jgi:hypothetical protein
MDTPGAAVTLGRGDHARQVSLPEDPAGFLALGLRAESEFRFPRSGRRFVAADVVIPAGESQSRHPLVSAPPAPDVG